MKDDEAKALMRTYASLERALDAAGGSVHVLELEKMSLFEFLVRIAGPNGIRFVYNRDEALQ